MLNLQSVIEYLVRGFAVAVALYVVMRDKGFSQNDILKTGLTVAVVFALLDQFAPSVGLGANLGAGVGLGMKLVGGGCGGDELVEM